MPHGYHGKILHVNLSDLSWEVETPPEEFYRKYMGGSALGMYYVLKNTPPNVGPFDPENTLALTLSVLTGVAISGQSRLTAAAKSPLTGAIGDSQSGGFFPAEMKFAGFDGVILYGKAENPVYLWINEGQVELRQADHLWGKDTAEVETLIKDELDDKRIQILQTGIAGENLVRFAALISMANRANGRTGLGAVMGSKNLKAVAVRGKMRPTVADKAGLNDLARWGAKNFPDSDVFGLGVYGTAEVTSWQDETGGLPTRNWASGTFEGTEALDGKTMSDTILKERDTCYACTVKCKRVVEITEGDYQVDAVHGGPEYETIATFGSYSGIDNLPAVSLANQYCNQYGMDTISCGATIAWAMDCFEQGILTKDDTGGIELRFGDAKAMTEMTEMIAKRQGFGDVLAEGSALAAEKLGKGQELVVAVKGMELPAHMPEVKRSLGLIYAVNPFGADHQSSEHDPSYEDYPERMEEINLVDPQPADNLNKEKVHYALTTQYLYSALDSVNICQFVFGPSWHLYGPEQLRQLVELVTGWDVSMDELLEVGARRLNMLRAYNAREGFGRDQDKLPPKLFKPRLGGATDGVALDEQVLEKAKDLYYEEAGWDISSGMPTKSRLEELSLGWVTNLLDS
ncbi:MAG: aldehyde ferredoxin oxidoreductase family protein [Anaerolineales bacterium]|nr:aldehyde ferredoxin oxidoreductase family protein [Chloroflexota bacterium]MBL6980076.1 aldehyde ferredoxin oxidoreductase family protein [Anaerolineales bacterium]